MSVAPEVWWVSDDRFAEHRMVGQHAERPERLLAVQNGLEAATASGLSIRSLPGRRVGDGTLLRGHTREHLQRVSAAVARSSSLDADTYTCSESEGVARQAVAAAVDLCAAVLGESGPNVGFAAVRPPGHHAERDRAMGFCLFSNAALAALEVRARGLAQRVAIVDWDVHHGNGTENVLWDEEDCLFISLHQHPLYPGTGAMNDLGGEGALGWNVNLPLASGSGDGDVVLLFDRVVVPLLERADPDLIIISAGFDAHRRDPLASLELSGSGFGWMTQRLRSLNRPIAALLEGGYDLVGLAEGVAATLNGLVDRFPEGAVPLGVVPETERVSERAIRLLAPYWPQLSR